MWTRRALLGRGTAAAAMVAGVGAGGALAGCSTAPPRQLNAQGQACFRLSHPTRLTCSDAVAPSLDEERRLRAFERSPDFIAVYVIRRRFGDGGGAARLQIDDGGSLVFPPFSMARLRLNAGPHVLWTEWTDGRSEIRFEAAAGERVFIEMRRLTFLPFQDVRYGWTRLEEPAASELIEDCRVIADLDGRRPPTPAPKR